MIHAALVPASMIAAGAQPSMDAIRTAIDVYAANAQAKGIVIAEEDRDLAEDCARLANQMYLEKSLKDTGARLISCEHEYEIKISNSIITMKPDLIYLDRAERYHLVDYKTKDQIPSDYTWFDLDPQMKIYNVGVHEIFGTDKPVFVEHLLIRREVPPGYGHRPTHNHIVDKRGREYDKKSTASTDPDDYIRLFPFCVSAKTVAQFKNNLTDMVREMESDPEPHRSASALCTFCPYFAICRREQAGESVSDAEAQKYINLVAGL
jgi:hypothetical protein